MNLLFAIAGEFPTYFVAVYVVGFLAAVIIGSMLLAPLMTPMINFLSNCGVPTIGVF